MRNILLVLAIVVFSGCSRDIDLDQKDEILVNSIVEDANLPETIYPGDSFFISIGKFTYTDTVETGDSSWSITLEAVKSAREYYQENIPRPWYSYILQALLAVLVIRVIASFYLIWFNSRSDKKRGGYTLSFRRFWVNHSSKNEKGFPWENASIVFILLGMLFILLLASLFYIRSGLDVLIALIFGLEIIFRFINHCIWWSKRNK